MEITKLDNGNLEIVADVLERREIKKLLKDKIHSMLFKEASFIADYMNDGNDWNFEQVFPEEVSILSDAPLISDGNNIYGYMDYQVKNFLKELAQGKSLIWTKA